MIKINLATRKQAASATGADGSKSPGGGLQGFLGGFKSNARLDGLKELPIRQIAVSALVCFAASYMLDSYKEDEVAKVDAVLAKERAEQTKLKTDLAKGDIRAEGRAMADA